MGVPSWAQLLSYVFFFNDTATTEIYTLSLHDALPIFLLGITPEGVEIAANAAKAMGAQFDVLVAAFIKLGSNLAPIGAIAESAPSEMDPDFQPGGALMDKLASAIDESRAR